MCYYCVSCNSFTEARRAVDREIRWVQVHSDGLWHKGDWNIILSCSLHLFWPVHPKGCKLPNLPSHVCNKPAESIVAQKWSQQLLSSNRNRNLSTEYLLTLIISRNLEESRQVTQNDMNFSPGHKVPSNYGSKKRSHCWGSYSKCVQKALFPWSR